MKKELKVGTRVSVTGPGPGHIINFQNAKGTIIVNERNKLIGVELDESYPGMHDCGGEGKAKNCYWVNPEHVTPLQGKDRFKPGDIFSALNEKKATPFIGCEVEAIDVDGFRQGDAWVRGKFTAFSDLNCNFPFKITTINTSDVSYSFIRLTEASFKACIDHSAEIKVLYDIINRLKQMQYKNSYYRRYVQPMIGKYKAELAKLEAEHSQS